jgi:hypothetical protein
MEGHPGKRSLCGESEYLCLLKTDCVAWDSAVDQIEKSEARSTGCGFVGKDGFGGVPSGAEDGFVEVKC